MNVVSGVAHLAQFGVVYPLLALWLNLNGMPAYRIGIVVASVWPGMLLGNLLTPTLLSVLSPRVVATGSCAGTALLVIALPMIAATQLGVWVAAAAVFGFLVGLRWVSVEGWLFDLIDGPLKGRLIAIHETIIYAAQSIGPLLIAAAAPLDGRVFAMAGVIAVGAAVLLFPAQLPPRAAASAAPARQPLQVLAGMWRERHADPSVLLGVLSGAIDGALLGMLTVHLVRTGIAPVLASLMLVAFGAGGMAAQFPLGWLCDRRGIAVATRVTAALGLAGVALLQIKGSMSTWAGVVLLGALAANGLTLSIGGATDHARKTHGDIVLAISRVSIAFTLGSALGPVAAGFAMELSARFALPVLTGAGCLGLWIWSRAAGVSRVR